MYEPESFGDRAARAARSNLVLSPVIALTGLASSIVVVRALSPGAFALYALAIALRGGIQFVADIGFGGASARAFAEFQQHGARGQAQRVYTRLAVIRAGIVIALAAAVALAPNWFSEAINLKTHERYFLLFLVVIAASEIAGGLGFYVLTGTLNHSTINKVLLAQSIVQPPLVITAAFAGLGLSGILAAVVLGSLFRAVALTGGSTRAIRRIEDRGAEIEGIAASYMQVASASTVGKVAGVLHSRQVVIPIVFSAVARSQVAVFSVAYDWVQQLLTVVSGPLYSLLLPVFSAQRRDDEFVRRFFQFATRSLALVVFPTAAVLLAVFPSMAAVVLPGAYSHEYAKATAFAYVFIPCIALEIVLSGPATALMLAHEGLASPYRNVKLVTAALAAVYVVTAGIDLLVVAGFMMAIRLASVFALHAELQRRLGLHVKVSWLARAVAASLISAASAAAVAAILPGRVGDLALGPVVGLSTFLMLVRITRLLHEADAAIAARVLPFGSRPLRLLMFS
jgi:O-antigen/teichoic acid export membrane protein